MASIAVVLTTGCGSEHGIPGVIIVRSNPDDGHKLPCLYGGSQYIPWAAINKTDKHLHTHCID